MGSRVNDLRQLLNDSQSEIGDPDYQRADNQSSAGNPPPAFLTKLWQLVNEGDPELVGWSDDGKSFIVKDQNLFAKRVLPNYFKHQKMNSFVRQLNMYGFKKVPKLSEGTLHTVDYESIEFQNELFIRGKSDLINKIRRKDAKPKPPSTQNKHVTDLLEDLQEQQKQTHLDFERLKEKNSDLWRQVSTLRKKHDKQQDTVNRLISFMIHYIQQTPAHALQMVGNKRAALALTNGQDEPDGSGSAYKMMRVENEPKVVPESPLSSALRPTRSMMDDPDQYSSSNTYFLKATSENAIMSSDPCSPEIQEIISDKPTHYNLELVDPPTTSHEGPRNSRGDPIKSIQSSITRQETTLSNIITNIMSDNQETYSFDTSDMNFDDFTAG